VPEDNPYLGLAWEATCVEIELDPVTLQIICRGIWVVIDAGTVLLPDIAQIHVERSALQNMSYAATDVTSTRIPGDPSGAITDYQTFGSKDLPPVHVSFIHHEGTESQARARGLGDQPVTGVAPAYLSAVSQATRLDFSQIPIHPEIIQGYLEKK
jgi:CO/xanthine dehydrogenase Mo-binding subunit